MVRKEKRKDQAQGYSGKQLHRNWILEWELKRGQENNYIEISGANWKLKKMEVEKHTDSTFGFSACEFFWVFFWELSLSLSDSVSASLESSRRRRDFMANSNLPRRIIKVHFETLRSLYTLYYNHFYSSFFWFCVCLPLSDSIGDAEASQRTRYLSLYLSLHYIHTKLWFKHKLRELNGVKENNQNYGN